MGPGRKEGRRSFRQPEGRRSEGCLVVIFIFSLRLLLFSANEHSPGYNNKAVLLTFCFFSFLFLSFPRSWVLRRTPRLEEESRPSPIDPLGTGTILPLTLVESVVET